MKFREFNKRLNEKMLKPTSPKMRLQMAIAIALDMGGNMTGAYKKIEKIEKGLGDHPAVKAALRFANEDVNEKMSAAQKKKRLQMIARAVEKMKEKELKMAKKDALAAIKALESVDVNEMKTFDQLYKGPPKKSQLLMDVQEMNKSWKNTKTKEGAYGGINDITIRFSAPPTGNVVEPDPRFKSLYPDGMIESDYKLGVKHAKDMLKVAQRLSSREPYKSAFDKPSMIEDPIQIYIGHQYKSGYDKNPKYKVDITPIVEEIAKISHRKEPAADARMKDMSGFYGGVSESVIYEASDGMKIDGRRKEFKEKIKKLAYEKMKKMMKNQKEQWEITEGKVERKEKELNLKLKELEYKMKLKDFMRDVVDSKLPKGKKEEEEPKKPDAKKEPEGMAEIKIDDTSSTNYNTLLKIAKDIGVDLSREDDHLLVKGEAKKIEDFKAQMDSVKEYHSVKKYHASIENHHYVKEEVQDLIEGYSRRINDKDVDREFADYLKASPPGMEKLSDFYGDVDKAREEMKQDFHPSNSARPNAWTALRYPVRDGDYYFAFISNNNKKNMKYNEALNDLLFDIKRNGVDASLPAKDIAEDELWVLASRFVEGKGDLGHERGNSKMKKRKHIGKFPGDLGAGDTMTREEIWAACLHLSGKLRESKIKERFNKKMTKAGIMVGKRRSAPKFKLESKMKLSTLQNKLKEARYGKSMNRKEIMRKHGNEMKKALRTGNLELSDKAEGDLIQYVMDNHPEEIRTDDPDEWIQWLDDNLEDFVRGRGY